MKPNQSNSRQIVSNLALAVLLQIGSMKGEESEPLTIIRQPIDFSVHSVSLGATIRTRVGVTGGVVPYSYQWQHSGIVIPSATNSTITLTNLQINDAGPYRAVVTDAAGASVESDLDELNVNPAFVKINEGPLVNDLSSPGGSTWFDYDNDGDEDLFLAKFHYSTPVSSLMYRNDGGGVLSTFTRLSNPLTTPLTYSIGAPVADFDNDGLIDLLLVRQDVTARNILYRNTGQGQWARLPDSTFDVPLVGSSKSLWIDYDRDGFVDLFNQNGYSEAWNDALYRNRGDGTFHKLTPGEVGLGNDLSLAYGCVATDFDNDGWPDIFMASTGEASGLFRNDGYGRYSRADAGIDVSGYRLLGAPGCPDFDSDGWPDFFSGAILTDDSMTLLLHRNLGTGQFADVAQSSGLILPWSDPTGGPCAWGDYDNDGYLDFIIYPFHKTTGLGVLFHNQGNGTFQTVDVGSPLVEGGSIHQEVSWVDYDNDGFLDCFHGCGIADAFERNYLYWNNARATGNTNHWLKVKTEGRVSNRAGIGAKVRVRANIGGKMVNQLRQISGNTGYVTSDKEGLIAHFGLGNATRVETLRIEWPSGIVQEFMNVEVDKLHRIAEHEAYAPTNALPAIVAKGWTTNGIEVRIQEPMSGTKYALEGSSDLKNWAMLLSRTSTGGTFEFADPRSAKTPARFYRVIVP